MLANVSLHDFKDFKPDVVICPRCTQRLMGVRDIRWGTNKVEFTYGCDACGNELDKTIAQDTAPEPAAFSPARTDHNSASTAPIDHDVPAPAIDDLGTFPFRRESSKPAPASLETVKARTERSVQPPRQAFIEDRAARRPRQVFDEMQAAPEQHMPTIASRASILLRDVAIFNL